MNTFSSHPRPIGPVRPFGLSGPLGPWRPLDSWVAGYALLTLPVLALGAARGMPGCRAQAALSLAVLAGVPVLARLSRDTSSRVLTFLRLCCAPLLYWVFYHQIQTLWPVLRAAPLDGTLAALEARLWGLQPSLAMQPWLPWRWLSELFCFAYFAYYLFVPVVCVGTLATRGYAAAERVILATTGCFFACYAFFWLFPTVGPHYWFPPGLGPQLHPGYLFNHVLVTLMARRALPRLFPALAVITALLLPGVVYLRAHYLVDVPAGLLAGLLAYAISRNPASRPW